MKISKQERKWQRMQRRHKLWAAYRDGCRALIKAFRQHNSTVAQESDKFSANGFRAALKNMRHDYSRAIAGRPSKLVQS